MCNLYSMTSNKAAIRDVARAMRDSVGNMPPLPGIYPDYAAPIVRNGADGERELVMARWGMPSPAFALEGKKTDPGVTNIRNVKSPHWRRWLAPEHRCLVPLTSFSENDRGPNGKPLPVWFDLSAERPLAFFAGIWTTWTSVRKLKEGEVTADLFGFLTTEPTAEVGAVHPKAMPVILTDPDEWDTWLEAPWEQASILQRPLPDGALQMVAKGGRQDGSA
ncbi:SOS response-associated peptidase [Roseomonas sp. ACRSG]|nr:SOS response-associated peptidase [Roseomonas sp. ACRSG]